jgi:endonuclease/exonuclease/phosphatase family metal-dependent hydrolase
MGESPGTRFHVALLSRPPIVEALNLGVRHPQLSRAALRVRVGEGAEALQLLVVHLESGLGAEVEARRMAELRRLVGDLADDVGPTVIVGDLNTNAPYHPVDPASATPDVQQRLAADPGLIHHDVVEHLCHGGWVDAYHRARPHETVHTFSTHSASTRLDYIFVDEALAERVVDAGVERRGFAPYCSDHYPMWVDLDRSDGPW